MNNHLSNEQFSALASGERGKAVAEHLQDCAECHEEAESLQKLLGVWVDDINHNSDRPEAYWRWQRETIAVRLSRREWLRPWQRIAWATATISLVLLATLASRPNPVSGPKRAPVDDNALLLSIEDSVSSDVPRALQPVALLTQEIDRAAENRLNQSD